MGVETKIEWCDHTWNPWRGWLVGIFNQGLWLWLILDRKLWGLLPLTLILSWRYAAALLRWKRDES